jgi:CheY-like chemotaxis protein
VTAEGSRRPLRLAGLRLLVVDDGLVNRELASGMLGVEGAHCEGAADGLQALHLLRAAAGPGGFDAVFLDVQMPVMDGLEAARHIRADPLLAALPVIAVSAGVLPHQRQAALEAGMDDFIAKPIQLDTLVDSLLRQLSRRQAAVPSALRAGARDPAPPTAHAPLPGAATAGGPVPDTATGDEALPAVPGVDGPLATRRLLGNRMLFLSMLRALRDDHADAPARARAELLCGDVVAAMARLHRLRGLAGNLAAVTVAARAARLEDALRAGDAAMVEPALRALAAALDEVLAGLPAAVERPYGEPGAPVPGSVPAAAGAIDALAGALAEGDMGAFALYQALRPALAARHGRDAVDRLDDAMDRLRFPQVIAVLRDWYPTA